MPMPRLRVHNFAISLDGAGPNQDRNAPLGYRCTEHVTTASATHVVLAKGS